MTGDRRQSASLAVRSCSSNCGSKTRSSIWRSELRDDDAYSGSRRSSARCCAPRRHRGMLLREELAAVPCSAGPSSRSHRHPVVLDLRPQAPAPATLRLIGERVGLPSHGNSAALFSMAPKLSFLRTSQPVSARAPAAWLLLSRQAPAKVRPDSDRADSPRVHRSPRRPARIQGARQARRDEPPTPRRGAMRQKLPGVTRCTADPIRHKPGPLALKPRCRVVRFHRQFGAGATAGESRFARKGLFEQTGEGRSMARRGARTADDGKRARRGDRATTSRWAEGFSGRIAARFSRTEAFENEPAISELEKLSRRAL